MKMKSESEVTQSCLTLGDPMDCSLPGSSVHGIFQSRVLECGADGYRRAVLGAEGGHKPDGHGAVVNTHTHKTLDTNIRQLC